MQSFLLKKTNCPDVFNTKNRIHYNEHKEPLYSVTSASFPATLTQIGFKKNKRLI